MIRRWKTSTITISGRVTSTEAAEICPHGDSNSPWNMKIRTGTVRAASVDTNVYANRNSFQAEIKTRMPQVTRPGAASGRMIRHSALSCVQPSISAASSSSQGTCLKKLVSAHSVNGSANEAYGMMSAWKVLSMPHWRSHMNNAEITDTSGNIDTLSTAARTMARPQNWIRANAYAPRQPSISTNSVVLVDTMALFIKLTPNCLSKTKRKLPR